MTPRRQETDGDDGQTGDCGPQSGSPITGGSPGAGGNESLPVSALEALGLIRGYAAKQGKNQRIHHEYGRRSLELAVELDALG